MQSTKTLPDWWRETARVVKTHCRTCGSNTNLTMFFAIVETWEKELERCHLLDRKDHQHVLVDPQRHVSQLMYLNISVHRLYIASQQITEWYGVLRLRIIRNWRQVTYAHRILKVDHCIDWTWYVPHLSSCEELISRFRYMFLSSATAERSFSNWLRSKS